jgi:hypothetical protein
VIDRDAVVPLLLEACPSFAPVWAEEEAEDQDDEGRLHYLDAAAFVRHIGALWTAGEIDELPAAFDVIERLAVEGDPYVSELAVIGYLEGLQMQTISSLGIDPETAFVPFFGPVSRRWWDRLNRFWAGDPRALQVEDP